MKKERNVRCYYNGIFDCETFQNEWIIATLLDKVGIFPDNKTDIVRTFSDLQLDGKLGHLVRHTLNLKCDTLRAVTAIAHVSETDEQSIGLMAFGWICSVVSDPNFSLDEVRAEMVRASKEDIETEQITNLEKLGKLLDKVKTLALVQGSEKLQKAAVEDMLELLSDEDFVKECKLGDFKSLCEKALKE